MLRFSAKYHFRDRTAYQPVVLVALFALPSALLGVNLTHFALLILAKNYYRVVDFGVAGIRALRITGCSLSGLIIAENMALLLFNLIGFVVGLISCYAISSLFPKLAITCVLSDIPQRILQLLLMHFFCVVVGNAIALSDLITIRQNLLRVFMHKAAFFTLVTPCVVVVVALSLANWEWQLLALAILVAIWYAVTSRYSQLCYFENYFMR